MWRTETQLDILFLNNIRGPMTYDRESAAAADIVFNLAVWGYV